MRGRRWSGYARVFYREARSIFGTATWRYAHSSEERFWLRWRILLFSPEERTKIAAAIEKVLLSLKHPKVPTENLNFALTVWGLEYASAVVEPEWKTKIVVVPRHEFKKAADGSCEGCPKHLDPRKSGEKPHQKSEVKSVPVGGIDYLADLL